jgi:nitroreductase
VELSEAVASRRMTRRFAARAVEEGLLSKVLEAARFAPAAGATAGVELLVLTDPDRRELFWKLASEQSWRRESKEAPGLLAAPVIIVPVADPAAYVARYGEDDKSASLLAGRAAMNWPVPYWIVDDAFVSMLLLLAAHDAGLGALFFQLHAPQESVLAGLGVPGGRVTIGAIALGHRAEESSAGRPRRAPRRRAGVHLNSFAEEP